MTDHAHATDHGSRHHHPEGGGSDAKPGRGGHHGHGGGHDHAAMVADFRRRFWVSLALSVPVLALAPMIQRLLAVREALAFPGDAYLQAALATAVFFYGGWPFLTGLVGELRRRQPGMMTDKTGTLTEGRFGVTDIIPLGDLDEAEVLQLAASLESQSEHPIAVGVVGGAAERGIEFEAPEGFTAIPGRGAEARVEGPEVKVVSAGYLEDQGLEGADERVRKVAEEGKTVVFVLVDGRVSGALALADVIRAESREGLARLHEMGVQVMMLTGDAEAVARWVAEELELDDYFAEVLPHEKAEKIKKVKGRDLTVAMTGDGVNDAPALVESEVGIAIGAGTDVAIESADIVLVRSDPLDVASVVELARATYRKMVQNLWWAAGYNIVAIPLAAGALSAWGVLLTPAVGAVFMSLSTVIVSINGRLLQM